MTLTSAAGLPDASARHAIESNLDDTLFVEAGAGTGKTSTLVERVAGLIREGVELRTIAAITFTEAAAAELRDRIRHRLEQAQRDNTLPAGTVDQLDDAAVCTLHAFAQRLLAQFPVEAGLPPGFEVLDEIESGLDFDERWNEFLDELYDRPDLAPVLLRGFAAGLRIDNLAVLARRFHDHRDRLVSNPIDVPRTPPIDIDGPLAALRSAAQLCQHALDPTDLLAQHILGTTDGDADDTAIPDTELVEGFETFARRLAAARDEIEQLYLLAHRRRLTCANGRRDNWSVDVDIVKAACREAEEACDTVVAAVRSHIAARLAEEVRRFTLDAAAGRMLTGRLAFHDLLICARDLLRDRADIRQRLAGRWQRLLVDEFQDTDPLQVELAVLLASEPASEPHVVAPALSSTHDGAPASTAPDRHATPPSARAARLVPGRLFFVGDAKQSIYRFRRADITLFNDVREQLAVEPVALRTNFRSVPGIVDWVNDVFTDLLAPTNNGAATANSAAERQVDSTPPQARHQTLDAHRRPVDGGSSVRVIGGAAATGLGEVRTAEAAEVAATIAAAVTAGWPVADRDQPSNGSAAPAPRAARHRDIAVLLPARTTLPYLEAALDDRAIPYRVESASLVWDTQPVRDLLALLRAIDDPADRILVATALRSSPGGCSDDDLLEYHDAGGAWNLWAPPPASLPEGHPAVVTLARLRDLGSQRWWLGVAPLVDTVVRRFRLMELALASDRARDRWRQLRFVIDQARSFAEQPGATLRGFLAWAEQQAADNARVREPVLPEDDHDAVRILTIHGAKGLEFPITILCGLNRAPRSGEAVDVVWDGDRPEVRIGRGFVTSGYEEVAEIEKAMAADERRRVLYVATTRARDHLVVSVHRTERDTKSDAAQVAAACEAHPDHWEPYEPPALTLVAPAARRPDARRDEVLHERRAWGRRREELIAGSRRAPVIAATAVAATSYGETDGRDDTDLAGAASEAITADENPSRDGDDKSEPGPEAEPWRRGRAGTAMGRAVHAVLQTVDLDEYTGDAAGDAVGSADVESLARAYAIAEGVADRAREVARLVRTALASDVVAEATRHRYWRELYVAAPLDGGVVEGFIDLLYDDGDSLVVVDYKTDAVRSDAEVETALERYRLQLGTYAFAVEQTTDRPVHRAALLFAAGGEARTRWLAGDNLAAAKVDAVQRATAAFTASRLAAR